VTSTGNINRAPGSDKLHAFRQTPAYSAESGPIGRIVRLPDKHPASTSLARSARQSGMWITYEWIVIRLQSPTGSARG
jgi:hypothetical protein